MLLTEILDLKGINTTSIKVVRHTVKRENIQKIVEIGNLDLYQSIQKSDVFKNINYIISFTDMEDNKALLYGVYKVNDVKFIKQLPEQLKDIPRLENWGEGPFFHYDLERINILDDLVNRLVIDWGKAALSWHQNSTDKEIVEILPKGYVSEFPGYENIILTFDEVSKLVKFPIANKQWKILLSKVYGVYIILDTVDGKQYIGSAYGKNGIWGRWSNYVDTKHGNNKALIELLSHYPDRYKKFQFSILTVLPNTSLKEEVLKQESMIKKKLGTKTYGLNLN